MSPSPSPLAGADRRIKGGAAPRRGVDPGAEGELLLACAMPGRGPDERTRSLLEEEIDWERLLESASRHGLLPLLHRHLNTTGLDRVPPAIRDRLRRHFQANFRRNLFLSGELFRVVEKLERESIPAVPYKGPALAASLYGHVALRQFTDLDLLVREKDVWKAAGALASLGYRSQVSSAGRRGRSFLQRESELLLARGEDRIFLEIHWRIAPPYFALPLDLAPLWARTAGPPASAGLSPEETLLILSAHGARHLWERLIWISDVARLLRHHPEMDWKGLLGQAGRLGAQRILHLALSLARDLLGTALPREVEEPLKGDRMAGRLAASVKSRLFRADGGSGEVERRFHFHLQARERPLDRLRYVSRLALRLAPADRGPRVLSGPLFPLRYLVRSLRLLRTYGHLLPRSLRHGKDSS